MLLQSLKILSDVKNWLIKLILWLENFSKVNKIVIDCNIIVKPWKLGSYVTKSLRDTRKIVFHDWRMLWEEGNWCNLEVLKLRYE